MTNLFVFVLSYNKLFEIFLFFPFILIVLFCKRDLNLGKI